MDVSNRSSFCDERTYLVRAQHVRVEGLAGDLVNEGMGDPGAVVARKDFAQLVRLDLRHRLIVRLRVVLDGDLSSHSTHSSNFAPG